MRDAERAAAQAFWVAFVFIVALAAVAALVGKCSGTGPVSG